MRDGIQQGRTGGLAPAAGTQHTDTTAEFQLAAEQAGSTRGIARPGIAHRERGSVRDATDAQAGKARDDTASITQPLTWIATAHLGRRSALMAAA